MPIHANAASPWAHRTRPRWSTIAGEVAERGGQGDRSARLVARVLSVPGYSRWLAADPARSVRSGYRQGVTMFTEELPWLRGKDQEKVMGQGIVDWLEWKRA
jgi:hypothetical protein